MATQQEIINTIVGSIMADDGAGSDLEYKHDYDDTSGYMELSGALDVNQLASEAMAVMFVGLTTEYGVHYLKAMQDHKKGTDQWLDGASENTVDLMVQSVPDKMQKISRLVFPTVYHSTEN